MRSHLSKHQGQSRWEEPEIQSAAAAAWHQRGVLMVPMSAITNQIERQFLENIGARLYGERSDDG